MLVRQSKNSFIRIYDNCELGYISNQLTKYDRTYNESGAVFLSQISRQPKDIKTIVDNISSIYSEVDSNTIANDFMSFIEELSESQFVVMGESLEELDQRKPRLASLQFELTSRCNERCIHCYIPNGKKNAGFDMSFERFKYILDQYAEMGGLQVTLSGGEALMNKDIVKMLWYCREKDMQISLLTNLISLKEELIPILKDVNISLIQVSLYSMNAEKHDFITTVKGSFEKTKTAIEKLHNADIPVQISCPIMKANKDGYDEVMKYAQRLRMKAQTDYIMMAQADLDTSNLANRISVEETEKVIRDIMENDVDYQTETLAQEPLSSISEEEFAEMSLCGAGLNDLCVTVNGDIYPCAGWQGFVVGNVFRESLKEIWEHSPKLEQIRMIKQKDFPKCLKCEARDFCNMCLVRNYNESGGDMFKINEHFCKVAFLNKQIAEEWQKSHPIK